MAICSDENAREDHTFSKKIEGDEGLDTVACLRGRLLAERQASRVAKEEEESIVNKLAELEKLLKEEIQLRDKAEKKLKFLKKKLESLNTSSNSVKLEHTDSSEKCESINMSSNSGQFEHSDLSEKCDNSCESLSISSASKHSEANEIKNIAQNPILLENEVYNHNVSEATSKDCDSQITDCDSDMGFSSPQILSKNSNTSTEDLRNDRNRLSSLSSKSSVTENESDDHADSFDNSMALVPVNMTATSQATSNSKPVNERVCEALDALKVAKERLQGSLGIRQMILIGTI